MIALNKTDLGERGRLNGQGKGLPAYKVSALTGNNVEKLKQGIYDLVCADAKLRTVDGVTINERQREKLIKAGTCLERAAIISATKGEAELLAVEIKEAIIELGEICGEGVSEEVISEIFERFCVGK
jgi:tRNA modification GTPase